MKVLMFGWEFPPFNSGGLGVACEGLAKGLSGKGIKINFVLPKKIDCCSPFCEMVFANDCFDENLKFEYEDSLLSPYMNSKSYRTVFEESGIEGCSIYSPNLFGEVLRYGKAAAKVAKKKNFDVIHAHDWLSYPAGLEAKKISGRPLVAHIHATEFDRTGGNGVDQRVYDIEREGMFKADAVIAVSKFTKNIVEKHYGIDSKKIHVVHNAIEHSDFSAIDKHLSRLKALRTNGKKIVLFLGRLTLQKGADYFIRAAKKVLEKNPDVFFVIVGSGDAEYQIIRETVDLGIADKVLFAGFLRGEERAAAYQSADLYVLPSVSEPFGITPLESLACGTPILISKQSGVSEVVAHALKVNFWDVDEMANQILASLNYNELHQELKLNGYAEVKKVNWAMSAQKCLEVYNKVLSFSV